MFKSTVYVLTLMAFTSTLAACSRDTVDSNSISSSPNSKGQVTNNIDRSYMLTAEEGSPRVSFVGEFTMSGTWNTTVRLSEPAKLLVDGQRAGESQPMSKEGATLAGTLFPLFSPLFWAASGTHNVTSVSSSGSHVVSWTDQLGKTFTDTVTIYPILSASVGSGFSRGGGFAISVSGTPAPGSDRYSAVISQAKADGSHEVVTASSSGGTIVFSATDLSKLQTGRATLSIERSVTTYLNSEGSGTGRAYQTYKTRTYDVSVD